MSSLNPVFFQEKNALASGVSWLWLYEVEVPTNPATRYRMTTLRRQVQFRGNTYYPFPVTHTAVRLNEKGDLPRVQLTVSNVSRELMATLNSYQGLVGQPVRIMLTCESALATDQPLVEQDFRILATNATAEGITADIADQDMYAATLPKQRLLKNFCRHQYRSAACGYAVDPSNGNFLSGCDKSLSGPNGCKVHGASESSAGVAVVHPARFGGFPGIPTPTTEGGV